MTKQKQLVLTVSDDTYEAVQESNLRMVMISPDGEQASQVYNGESGYLPYDTVQICSEDGRKRKLDFAHAGSDAVLNGYKFRVGTETVTVRSRQLRVVLGKALEPVKDAIETKTENDADSQN